MPIFEFYSPDTGKIYSFFARTHKYSDKIPLCPDGKNHQMKKKLSSFSVSGSKTENDDNEIAEVSSQSEDPFAGMAADKVQGVMKELEGAMSGMDDNNPDPRQMGALMRKMCDLTGEKINGSMEEIVRKLEEGMDPQELEDKMGDGLDLDGQSSTEEDFESSDGIGSLKKPKFSKLRHDPTLYEFEDYISC
jgi:hypothetical protein